MGTNYYALIIPKKERTKKIIDDISSGNFSDIIDDTVSQYGLFDMNSTSCGKFHLGKMSYGWKFLWDPNVYIVKGYNKKEGYTERLEFGAYPLTQKGINDFLNRDDVLIIDEYCELKTFDDIRKNIDVKGSGSYSVSSFMEIANYSENHNMDGQIYYDRQKKLHDIFLHSKTGDTSGYKSKLDIPPIKRFNDIDTLLKQKGFDIFGYGDFYSDGLRFADSVNFS